MTNFRCFLLGKRLLLILLYYFWNLCCLWSKIHCFWREWSLLFLSFCGREIRNFLFFLGLRCGKEDFRRFEGLDFGEIGSFIVLDFGLFLCILILLFDLRSFCGMLSWKLRNLREILKWKLLLRRIYGLCYWWILSFLLKICWFFRCLLLLLNLFWLGCLEIVYFQAKWSLFL